MSAAWVDEAHAAARYGNIYRLRELHKVKPEALCVANEAGLQLAHVAAQHRQEECLRVLHELCVPLPSRANGP